MVLEATVENRDLSIKKKKNSDCSAKIESNRNIG